ncbi:hypothetical protein F2Q70_00003888 [Brassica cretica]|uniref:Uncharacterized protein n=1 Tax=Brassica cretica TaxID=69181 RepID=A0A8S9IWR5_BRACR|nr:hypothetical protein F2Q70_00003888 [Brassica cretica]
MSLEGRTAPKNVPDSKKVSQKRRVRIISCKKNSNMKGVRLRVSIQTIRIIEKVSIDTNYGLSIDTPFSPSIDATTELSIDVPSTKLYRTGFTCSIG